MAASIDSRKENKAMNKIDPRKPEAQSRLPVLTLSLSMLLASLGTSIANIALPTLAADLSLPIHNVQWVVTSYLAALTITVVFAGRLGDRFGLRRMLLIGLSLFLLASLLCGLSTGLWQLVTARALQGVGAAFLMTLSVALARELAGEDRIGRAMGLLGTTSALGTAFGPTLGGTLLAVADWHFLFFVLVPFGMLGLALSYRSLPPDTAEQTQSAGLVGLPPMTLLPSLLANLLVAAVMMTTLVVGPFFLGIALGLGTASIGLAMSIGPAISILSGVPSGHLVDRLGANRVMLLGLAALATGAFGLAILPGYLGLVGYVVAIAVLTPGYQLFQAANNTSVMAGVTKDQRGVASGLLGLSRNLGLVAGASAMAAVFAAGVGASTIDTASSSAVAHGMALTFALAGGLILLAIGITITAQRLRR
jgi:MFS family permease